jgi:hypothetical protein
LINWWTIISSIEYLHSNLFYVTFYVTYQI